jgi:hypothetical protein
VEADQLIAQLALGSERIASLVAGVSTEQARWRPAADAWSLLEVVNHLWDEEREDFRSRLRLIWDEPAGEWRRLNPGAWVAERNYNARALAPALAGFLAERAASLAWLRGLTSPDWEASVAAPWGGRIRAGDILAAWAGHDVLHLRQLVELHWAHTNRLAAPYTTMYAGDW